jgi:hypothetical protein
MREKAAAEREAELPRARNVQLEASSAELRELVRVRLSGRQGRAIRRRYEHEPQSS